jgi:hypothetical protein
MHLIARGGRFHRGIDSSSSGGDVFLRECGPPPAAIRTSLRFTMVGLEDGHPFIVTGYIDGVRLNELIARQQTVPYRAAAICSRS